MEKDKCKSVFYNSYKCDETVVRVNEYSTISAELVTQMISVDFPVHYNCIVVRLSSSRDFLEQLLEDFVEFADKYFSVVLIQRVGVNDAIVNVFSPRNMHLIQSKLSEFESFYLPLDVNFRMQY